MLKILQGDWIEQLRTLPDASVHCCVTSPPYWGLRDYAVAGQLGLEKTPEEYVAKLVEGFREVRRVLRDDGTCWINLGDSYGAGKLKTPGKQWQGTAGNLGWANEQSIVRAPGLKPKDLVGIPWRVAFALQADGWVLRQEIIWEKPNPMPESVRDRCTKAHEQIFMFAKAKWSGRSPGRFSYISVEDARWLALFLDTEGNICAKRAKASSGTDHFGAQICFANTSRALLDRAHSIIRAGTVLTRPGRNAPMFYYQLSNIQAADLLYELYPHLIIKQRQAALAIHLQSLIAEAGRERRSKEGMLRGRMRDDSYTEELIRIWATMKSLNHFGNPDVSWVPTPQYGRWANCQSYFYDAEAIKEPFSDERNGNLGKYTRTSAASKGANNNRQDIGFLNNGAGWNVDGSASSRNRRTVWTIPSQAYPESHFATFPEDLIKPCIMAGTSAKGCCPKCGAPWERVMNLTDRMNTRPGNPMKNDDSRNDSDTRNKRYVSTYKTTGWQPTCDCYPKDPQPCFDARVLPCTVLDPFGGSGTTGQVAMELGRKSILIELNPKYVELIERRTNVTPGLPLA